MNQFSPYDFVCSAHSACKTAAIPVGQLIDLIGFRDLKLSRGQSYRLR